MPRGGFRPGAGRPRKVKPGEEPAEPKVTVNPGPALPPPSTDPAPGEADAKAWLLAVMQDPAIDFRMRQDAAKALLPYQHAKLGETGKKEQREKDAHAVASKFTPAAAPRLAAAGGKKV